MSGLPTSKMMVNHNRMRENNMAKDQAQKHWETIADAIQKIYDHKASSLSYEELYRTAYSLVLHKHGEMLYNNVKNITVELLKPIAERILETHDDAFLIELNKTWSDEKMCIIMIKDILLYMNKNYVPKTKLPPVEHMQTSQFKHHVVLHPLIKQRFLNRLMS
jgi:cullin 3